MNNSTVKLKNRNEISFSYYTTDKDCNEVQKEMCKIDLYCQFKNEWVRDRITIPVSDDKLETIAKNNMRLFLEESM